MFAIQKGKGKFIVFILSVFISLLLTFNTSLASEPIKIGHLNDITGALATYAKGHEASAKAAIKRINENGGIDGRKVEYYPEDTASDPKTATEKFRRLVYKYDVDFILGSDSSSCCVATNPLAEEFNVIIFQQADSDEVTKKGNRYVFQTLMPAKGEMKQLVEQVWDNTDAKKWAAVNWDYNWGHSCSDNFGKYLEEKGGTFLGKTSVPSGETDMSRYVRKIPEEAEGVALFLYGSGGFNMMKELNKSRPDLERCGRCVFEGVHVTELGDYANDVRVYKSMIQVSEDVPDERKEYIEHFRNAINVDKWGKDKDTGEDVVYPLSYSDWESLYFIKEAVEATGWKSKDDNMDVIKYLEGLEVKASKEHPQGDKWIRAEDHIWMQPSYMCITRDNRIRLEKTISAKDGEFELLNNYLE